ncbi:hypothetical protein SAMN04488511_11875 [Pedobacter suwonensis]|uniref:PH domain-containing protein n=1 Tax=Pedobacter suwonensis TaxID=332999 RepID=A0A1I0U4A5_9SPHI|nr:hypothetical protein [Pedobacter suwonensis]SFA57986.1 hypothetical protein SAMN04488511_11875 [Pedobacter suwonensis]
MEFEEQQHLKLWWLYLLVGVDAIIVLCIVLFDKGGMSFTDLKAVYFAPLWAVILPFAIIYLIQQNVLTLRINEEGIYYRYFPFKARLKHLKWDEIAKAHITKYDAFGDYGGYGVKIRLWFKFDDKAYILNDKNRGLQLEFKNGKKLLFSSNRIDEMELFLINLKTRYHIQAIQ